MNEELALKLRAIANELEQTRIEIYQFNKGTEPEINDELFKLQSDIRDIANIELEFVD